MKTNYKEKITMYHKALADVLHLIDIEDFSEGSADRCQIEDAWEVLNNRGEKRE